MRSKKVYYIRLALWVFVALNIIVGVVLSYIRAFTGAESIEPLIGLHFGLAGVFAFGTGLSYLD